VNKRINLVGKTFTRLTVVEEIGRKVRCICFCGNEKTAFRGNVTAGYTKSCGCLRDERVKETNTRHGFSGEPIYMVWRAMHTRCYNPNHRAYPWYGGKGIKVCERWHNAQNFIEDMLEGYEPGLTLDRKRSAEDYSKDNCRWKTKSENSRRELCDEAEL
jgi:hypothetical protein